MVLMDIQMPELGGHATTRCIRMHEIYAALPIVAMTAHATQEEREKCLASGMQDHIIKPIDPDRFYQTLARWLTPSAAAPIQGTIDSCTVAIPSAPMPIEIPGFDTADSIERLADDVDLYHRVLELMIPSLQGALEKFNAAVDARDRDETRSTVHGIRGMAANVGATLLSEHARELERKLTEESEHANHLGEFRQFRQLIEQTLQLVKHALATRRKTLTP
jgi:HPt (histidine-containing phosphotransfer) domain-containing protein